MFRIVLIPFLVEIPGTPEGSIMTARSKFVRVVGVLIHVLKAKTVYVGLFGHSGVRDVLRKCRAHSTRGHIGRERRVPGSVSTG